ncbi:MAG: DUF4294 domain-containing protein [Bacteroidota bacterium]|nr:DUF4294 domain-containing protein [Bacteroidota bacterium]
MNRQSKIYSEIVSQLRKICITAVVFLTALSAGAQKKLTIQEILDPNTREKGDIVRLEIIEGDTNYLVKMRPIKIFPPRKFKNKREKRRYNRLVRNVKKVYPYSQIIKQIFYETELTLLTLETEKARRKYIKRKEKELKKEFEKDIRHMTYSQGRILIRLVDRETGHTTYDIVKHFKGNISAIFWQSIARLFSTNLKYDYDKSGDEKWIEEIVARIENGQL